MFQANATTQLADDLQEAIQPSSEERHLHHRGRERSVFGWIRDTWGFHGAIVSGEAKHDRYQGDDEAGGDVRAVRWATGGKCSQATKEQREAAFEVAKSIRQVKFCRISESLYSL